MYIRYPLSQYRVHWCYTPLTPLISALTSALDPQLFSLSNHYGPVQVSVYLYISIHFQWFVHYIARHNYWYFSTNSGLVCTSNLCPHPHCIWFLQCFIDWTRAWLVQWTDFQSTVSFISFIFYKCQWLESGTQPGPQDHIQNVWLQNFSRQFLTMLQSS